MIIKSLATLTLMALPLSAFAQTYAIFNTPQPWSDSYSVGGQCYCDTNFDHGLRSKSVETPAGVKSIVEICADITATFGSGSRNNRVYFNTVHCGFGPRNDAADETVCPGIPRAPGNYTGNGCHQTGATWNLDKLYGATNEEPAPATQAPVTPSDPTVPSSPSEDSQQTEESVPAGESIDSQETGHTVPAVESTDSQPGETGETIDLPVNEGNASISQPMDSNSSQPSDDDSIDTATILSGEITTADHSYANCSSAEYDSDGDGFGWEDGKTCISVFSTAQGGSSIPTTLPQCTTGISDIDGDGYGWENNQLCMLAAVQKSQTQVILVGFPTCSDETYDSDGDGYGWENNKSCIVSDSTSDSVVQLILPRCSADISDTDNDGYGWENNQSCVFGAPLKIVIAGITYNICSEDIQDTDSDGYGWENDTSCAMPSHFPHFQVLQPVP